MVKRTALIFMLATTVSSAFVVSSSHYLQRQRIDLLTTSSCVVTRRHYNAPPSRTRLFLANGSNTTASTENDVNMIEKIDFDDEVDQSPFKMVKDAIDAFSSSSLFTALLFLTPFLANPKIRNAVPVPVLAGFTIVSLAFYTYQSRVAEVDMIVPRRKAALQALRDTKTRQLSSAASVGDVESAASSYEEVLRKELGLRVIIPGIFVLKWDPEGADLSAAKQFLRLEITENCELVPIDQE